MQKGGGAHVSGAQQHVCPRVMMVRAFPLLFHRSNSCPSGQPRTPMQLRPFCTSRPLDSEIFAIRSPSEEEPVEVSSSGDCGFLLPPGQRLLEDSRVVGSRSWRSSGPWPRAERLGGHIRSSCEPMCRLKYSPVACSRSAA